MAKMLVIERCCECPECSPAGNQCMVTRKPVDSTGLIPDWCPLADFDPETDAVLENGKLLAEPEADWDEILNAPQERKGEGDE